MNLMNSDDWPEGCFDPVSRKKPRRTGMKIKGATSPSIRIQSMSDAFDLVSDIAADKLAIDTEESFCTYCRNYFADHKVERSYNHKKTCVWLQARKIIKGNIIK